MSRVYFFNNVLPTAENPRAGSYAETMADELCEAGHEVDKDAMFFNKPEITIKDKIIGYVKFWSRLPMKDLSHFDIVYINHFTYCFPILLNPTLRKVDKVYVHWHGKELVRSSRFNRTVVKFFGKRLKKYRHIAPSEFFKTKILEFTPLSKDQIEVSPSGGVNTLVFKKSEKSESDKLIIGFPGEIKTTKGADVLLEIMKRHNEIERLTGKKPEFHYIAYGPDLERFSELFKSTDAELKVYPKMKKEEMPEFYRELDVALVLSSAVIGESLGLVALEAMSCDVPVIAHDICAFPEFVVSGVSGELTPYSESVEKRVEEVIKRIEIIARTRNNYKPRNVIEEKYSKDTVIEFYKTL